jgi:acetylcholinesterase
LVTCKKVAEFFLVTHASGSRYFFNDTFVDTLTPGALEAGLTLMDYFISFIDSLDPNDGKGIQRPQWSYYSKEEQVRFQE